MQDDLIERLRRTKANNGHYKDDSRSPINPDGPESADRIAALEAELERHQTDGIHTCHDQCQRPACVLRRENAALEAKLAEKDALLRWVHKAAKEAASYPSAKATREALTSIKDATDAD